MLDYFQVFVIIVVLLRQECRLSYFIIWQGKSERSDWFFLGRDFAIRTVSVETVISWVFFCFRKPANSKQVWCECHIINYLLT